MRPTRSTVTFHAPFTLNPVVGELPAGTYDIEVDEEDTIVGQRAVYCRVATLLLVHGRGTTRTVKVDPTSWRQRCTRTPEQRAKAEWLLR